MTIRLHLGVLLPLAEGSEFELPQAAVRHLQVLRAQPGQSFRIFDGAGRECWATVTTMGRRHARASIGGPFDAVPELPLRVTLALGVPANERMDALVEKATELGAAGIQPLLCERSVVRLDGERAVRRQAHWQAVAVAACEQCGRASVPPVAPLLTLAEWLAQGGGGPAQRWLLSTRDGTPMVSPPPLGRNQGGVDELLALSGPEGGLTPAEEDAAVAGGFVPTSLGARILRADTAPLALMAWVALHAGRPPS
jgi:16S rRNA (uracil1498-N3)-methyltransferase